MASVQSTQQSFEPSADLPDLPSLDNHAGIEDLLETPIPGLTPASSPTVDGIRAKTSSPFRPLLTEMSGTLDQAPNSNNLASKVQNGREYKHAGDDSNTRESLTQISNPIGTPFGDAMLAKAITNAANEPDVSFQDYLAFRELSFSWAESYDTKNFAHLATILAPELHIDYSIVAPTLPKVQAMPAGDFLAFVSSPHFLGSPFIHTQHLLGASKFKRLNADEALGSWQIRAAHQRYGVDGVVECNGHGHAMIEHWYRKVETGVDTGKAWKLAGIRPNVRWNEGNFEKIFQGPT